MNSDQIKNQKDVTAMNDPYVLIDAWFFGGFDYMNGEGVERCGVSGTNIRVIKGEVIIESSWGDLDFFDGDKILIVDVAACVSSNKIHILNLDPIDAFTLVFLHELSHWAEEHHRPDREHSQIWDPFIASIIKQTKRTDEGTG